MYYNTINKNAMNRVTYFVITALIMSCTTRLKEENKTIRKQTKAEFKLSGKIFRSKRDTLKLRTLMSVADSMGYTKGVIQSTDLLGVFYRNRGKYEKSIGYHKKALSLANETRDTMQMLFALNNLGTVYRRIDDFPQSTESYLDVVRLINNYSNNSKKVLKSRAVAYNGLGNISMSQSDLKSALDYFRSAISVEEKLNSWRGLAIDYLCMGSTYLGLNNIDSARYCYEKSLDLNIKNNSAVGQSICYKDLGYLYYNDKQYNNALVEFRKCLDKANETKEPFYIIGGNISVGKGLLALKKYGDAYKYLKKGHDMAVEIKSNSEIASSSELLSEYYEKIGKPSEALSWYKRSKKFQNEIYNDKNSERIGILNARFDVANKERIINAQKSDIQSKENRLRINRIVTVFVVVVFLLLVLLAIFLYNQNRSKQKADKLQMEQRILRSQMNPHFIFNSLGAIQSYMYKNDSKSAARYLGDFASLMRSVLDNSRQELITFDQEIKTLNHYLELEKLRMNDSFDFKIDVDSEIETEFEYIPPMLLQPFFENAIIHGFRGLDHKGEVELNIKRNNGEFEFNIFDNGVGFKSENNGQKGHKSHGLNIFKERIQNIYGKNKINFNIENIDGNRTSGTMVSFNLPIINN